LIEQLKPKQSADWDLYRALREQWTHEDNLANHRVMWLTLSQGLLLTAFGSILPAAGFRGLMIGFPIFGIVVSAVIGLSIYAAVGATHALKQQYDEAGLNQLCAIAPDGRSRFMGNMAARALPFVFVTVWVLALVGATAAR
jgi:hypothetical protein